jgi:hypothetical protein
MLFFFKYLSRNSSGKNTSRKYRVFLLLNFLLFLNCLVIKNRNFQLPSRVFEKWAKNIVILCMLISILQVYHQRSKMIKFVLLNLFYTVS